MPRVRIPKKKNSESRALNVSAVIDRLVDELVDMEL
jgi:hypothetical protein